MSIRSLPAFLLIAFGVPRTIMGPFTFCPDQLVSTLGPISERYPLFKLSVYSLVVASVRLDDEPQTRIAQLLLSFC